MNGRSFSYSRELMNKCLLHCTYVKRAAKRERVTLRPKHHLWVHLTARAVARGNPRCACNTYFEATG